MAITSAISDLFSSIYELFASVFGAIYAVFASIVNAVFSFVNGIFTLAGDVLGGFIDVTTGLGKFIVGNIVILSIGAVGAFVYVRYTAQGQQLANKKTN